MLDFLTFKTFITPTFLLIFYYLGAVLIPLMSWYLANFVKNKYFSQFSKQIQKTITSQSTLQQRMLLLLFFIFCFLCIELFWRIMFEFFVAYFDMHEALMQLNKR